MRNRWVHLIKVCPYHYMCHHLSFVIYQDPWSIYGKQQTNESSHITQICGTKFMENVICHNFLFLTLPLSFICNSTYFIYLLLPFIHSFFQLLHLFINYCRVPPRVRTTLYDDLDTSVW